MGRSKPTTTTPKGPSYDKLKPAHKAQLRQQPNPDFTRRRELMGERPVFHERGIRLQGLPESSLIADTIAHYELHHFCEGRGAYDIELVRDFYASLHKGVFNEFGEVMVRGHKVTMKVSDIHHYYGLPRIDTTGFIGGVPPIPGVGEREEHSSVITGALRRNGHSFWNKEHGLKKSQMHIDTAFWMVFLTRSLKPSTHNHEANSIVARVLYCIQSSMIIDVACIIHREIIVAASDTSTGILPFPCLISAFCIQAGIESQLSSRPPRDLDERTYTYQITYSKKHETKEVWEREDVRVPVELDEGDRVEAQSQSDDEDEDYEPAHEGGSTFRPSRTSTSHGSPPWSQLCDQMNRIEGKVDEALTKIGELQTSVRQIEESLEDRGFVRT
ncbi:hypothetical protein L6452_02973 [Arctium lappa]|uniref:Uncharacterized protein n=1 Tax=Arctium lappa TaxID=4217 RepID=A0ACB9FKE6_ARCLA|nr:hypothetical protein L6452_02973 [Arctium lappa]